MAFSEGREARAPADDTKALFDTAAFPVGGLFVHVFRIGRAAGSWKRDMTDSDPWHRAFPGWIGCLSALTLLSHLCVTVCICTGC